MNTTSEKIDYHRRHLLSAAAVTAAAAQLGMLPSASAQPAKTGAPRLPADQTGDATSRSVRSSRSRPAS